MAARSEPVGDREFVISRVFDAPRETVYRAWTDPGHMARWWGPKVFTNPVCELDVRPGGAFLIVMRAPDGTEFPFRGTYREVVPPAKLVYTDDASGMPDAWHDMVNPGRDKSAGKPAIESVTTVTFEDLGGKTRLTIHMLFASAAVRDAMIKIQMAEGWAESLDKLGQHVAAA